MPYRLPEFSIVRDTRENNGWIFEEEEKVSGKCRLISTVSNKLDAGDYSILGLEQIVCIERKSGFDEILGNLSKTEYKQRFLREMELLKEIEHPYILIESILNQSMFSLSIPQSRVPISRVVKELVSISHDYHVNVMFVGDSGKRIARYIFEDVAKKYLR